MDILQAKYGDDHINHDQISARDVYPTVTEGTERLREMHPANGTCLDDKYNGVYWSDPVRRRVITEATIKVLC